MNEDLEKIMHGMNDEQEKQVKLAFDRHIFPGDIEDIANVKTCPSEIQHQRARYQAEHAIGKSGAFKMEKYSVDQIYEIFMGLAAGVEISYMLNTELDWRQMLVVRIGLERGINPSIYARPEFTPEQMWEILYGICQKVDISKYADPAFDSEQMRHLREAMVEGVDVSDFADHYIYADAMLEIIIAKKNGFDNIMDKVDYTWSDDEISKLRLSKMIGDMTNSKNDCTD